MFFVRLLLALVFILLVASSYGASEARRDPVIRQAAIAMDGLDRPIRLALISDTHMSGPDMPPERLARIVAQINAQRPDLIVLAGDFMSEDKPMATRYTAAESVAPFAALRAPMGVIAVLGNHDYHRDSEAQLGRSFAAMGITLLNNSAVRRGPLSIGGVEDLFHGHPDIKKTVAAIHERGGAGLLVSHNPDVFPQKDTASIAVVLAGHTHCGQVKLPFVTSFWVPSRFYYDPSCGVIRDHKRTMVVSGGAGTSRLPIRLHAPPEFWIVTLSPRDKSLSRP